MRKKIRKGILSIFILFIIIITYFYPFETDKRCGELSLCWVTYGVYTYDYDSEQGNPYFGRDIIFYEKVGGFWEYIGLKEINCQ